MTGAGNERSIVHVMGRRATAPWGLEIARAFAHHSRRPLATMRGGAARLGEMRPAPALVVKAASAGWRGSNADRPLLRALRCPVLLAPTCTRPRGAVMAVVLLDGEGAASGDRVVLGVAAAVAAWWEAELHVVHPWSVLGESILSCSLRGVGPVAARRAIASAAEGRLAHLSTLLDRMEIDATGWGIVRGPLRLAVLRAAAAADASLIVASRRWHRGLRGLLQHSPTDHLLGAPGPMILSVTDDDGGLSRVRTSACA